MKSTLFVLCLLLTAGTFSSCKKESAADNTTAVAGKIETATFHIEGMSCAVMCAGKIQQELSKMGGVKKAVVDFDKKSATVEYDAASVTPQQLKAKVESVADGKTYKVSDLKSTADHAMVTNRR